jgi:myo-inositol-1(or 4)-monophosphatase
MDYSQYLNFAKELAIESTKIINTNYKTAKTIDDKSDGSFVTNTDIEINSLVINKIKNTYPSHRIVGEEESNLESESEFIWVCDPIDGTLPFAMAVPIFCFSLGLVHNGIVVVGVVVDCCNNQIYFGQKDCCSFTGILDLNSKINQITKLRVNNNTQFAKSVINVESGFNPVIELWDFRKNIVKEEAFCLALFSAVFSGIKVASGDFTALVFAGKSPWDIVALKIIVEEAGGIVTDINGKEQDYSKPINGAIVSNKNLHPLILENLAKNILN